MEAILLSISPYDPLWMAIAFALGLVLKLFGLPPLIGFLLAGFFLHAMGAESDDFLNTIADLGITLLLFSIGLKLKLKALASKEVWGVATIHMVLVTMLFSGLVMLLATVGLPMFIDLDLRTSLLIGFVLSFSSTVFAIKILDELGALSSKHGQVAIGVLVIQDIAAVAFLAAADGKIPSPWVVVLLLLIPVRPLLHRLLEKSGHGELLVLFGIVIALSGADIFEIVGIKGDVGALVFGMLLASHSKATELSKALLSFKDLFLVGFFLTIGMTALPGWNELLVALIFLLFLPVKVALYFGLFNAFFLRASTSWRTSLNLANYSEFGLIVGALASASGWLPKEWLAVFAITLSLSFIISAPLINWRDGLYQNWRSKLKRLERSQRLAGEEDLELHNVKLAIFGMGRMGSAAYTAMEADYRGSLVGVELDAEKAKNLKSMGRLVINGDATNPDFWIRAKGLTEELEWVMLTMPSHKANLAAIKQLNKMGYQGKIAATAKFPDEEQALKDLGVTLSFNIYSEAGSGFANNLKQNIS